MRFTTQLLPSRSGNLGILTLNNPSTLNALTVEMMQSFQHVLAEWYADDGMAAILVKSSASSPDDDDSGDTPGGTEKKKKTRAFCAGGDVKHVYRSGMLDPTPNGAGASSDFFREEYRVNYLMATAAKPQVSLWDGVVMGGGAGISVHGRYRVATENALFAMPETALGLFPDVGSMFWMPRLLTKGQAAFLALTGHRLKPEDLLFTGLATHYVPSSKLPELELALVEACNNNNNRDSMDPASSGSAVVAPVLMSFHENPPVDPLNSTLAKHRGTINTVFGQALAPLSEQHQQSSSEYGVEGIVAALEQHGSDITDDDSGEGFGPRTLETLRKMSPTSLKVTLEGLRRGAACDSIGDDLRMEFRMAQACMRPGSDFYEGVRAALIDRDFTPKWNPDSLGAVTPEMVESYFAPLEYEWEPPELPSATPPSK